MEDLKRLARNWRRADAALKEARKVLATALLEATEAEVPQKDIVAATGINRETIRVMCASAREERRKESAVE
jgi:hypothetical protein